MAKKILGGVGKVLGIGGKKKAAEPAASATESTGPKLTALGGIEAEKAKRRRGGRQEMPSWALGTANPADLILNRSRGMVGRGMSILSDKLGG